MEKIELNTGIVLGFEYVAFYQGQTDSYVIVPKSYDTDTFLDAHDRLSAYGELHDLNFRFLLHAKYDKIVKEIAKGERVGVYL